MNINTKYAEGIELKDGEVEGVIAIKKKDAPITISKEVWFKGMAKDVLKMLEELKE